MKPADNPRPVFLLRLQAERSCADPTKAVRHLLKLALRRFGLRAIFIVEEQRK